MRGRRSRDGSRDGVEGRRGQRCPSGRWGLSSWRAKGDPSVSSAEALRLLTASRYKVSHGASSWPPAGLLASWSSDAAGFRAA